MNKMNTIKKKKIKKKEQAHIARQKICMFDSHFKLSINRDNWEETLLQTKIIEREKKIFFLNFAAATIQLLDLIKINQQNVTNLCHTSLPRRVDYLPS